MDNTINPQESQLTPDNISENLAFSTRAMEQHLPQAPQEATQTQETAPQEAENPEEEKQPTEEKDPMKDMELMFTTKLDEIRKELKEDNQREIDELKATIQEALSEEDEQDETSKDS